MSAVVVVELSPADRMLAERAAQGLPLVPAVSPEVAARLRRFIESAQARAAARAASVRVAG